MATSQETKPVNPFDQFDTPATPAASPVVTPAQAVANPFDQFDTPTEQPGLMAKAAGTVLSTVHGAEQAVIGPIRGVAQIAMMPVAAVATGIDMVLNAANKNLGNPTPPGMSLGDRFSNEYNVIMGKADTKIPLAPQTQADADIQGAIGSFFSKIFDAAGDAIHSKALLIGRTVLPEDSAQSFAAGSGALTKAGLVLGTMAGGGKVAEVAGKTPVPETLTGNLAADFKNTARLVEASQVGDYATAMARKVAPDKSIIQVATEQADKELGLTKNANIQDQIAGTDNGKDVTLGTKIYSIISAAASKSGEVVPPEAIAKYTEDTISKLVELQRRSDVADYLSKPKALPFKPQYVLDEPIVVDSAGVASLRAKYNATLDDVAQAYGTKVDRTGASGNTMLAKLAGVPKQSGILDVSGLGKGAQQLAHLGDGVSRFAALGLVRPPTVLKYLHSEPGDNPTMYRVTDPGVDTTASPGMYVTDSRAFAAKAQAEGKVVTAHQLPVDDLVESTPNSYVYAPKGTDLSSIINYRDAQGNAVTFGDMLPESNFRKDLREQAAYLDSAAKDAGYKTVDELQTKAPKLFDDAAARWREAHKQAGILDVSGLESDVQAAKNLVRRAVRGELAAGSITPEHMLRGTSVDELQHLASGGKLDLEKYATTIHSGDMPVYGKGAGIIFPPEAARDYKGSAEALIQPDTNPQTLKYIVGDRVLNFQEMKDFVGKKPSEAPSAEDKLALARILSGQRGMLDISGLASDKSAADTVKAVMQKNRDAADTGLKVFGADVANKAIRAVYAHDYNIRTDLNKAGIAGQIAHDRMVVQNGATMSAKTQMDAINRSIFDNFNSAERANLDEVTRLRRIIQIDTYKGAGVVRHEGDITGPMAAARLEQMRVDLGEGFNKVNDGASSIFEQQKILLDKLKDAGIISSELHQKLYNLDYTRTEYLDKIDPLIPIASHVRNMPTSIRSSGIPEIGRGKIESVYMDSQGLLMEDLARVENRIARNNTLQAVRQLALENPDNGIVRPAGPGSVTQLKNGDFALKHTPEGWTSIGVRVGGKQEFIQMKDSYAEQFVARPEAMPEWLAITFRTISGTSLIKATSTGMNPSFIIAGIPMDIFHTWAENTNVYSPHVPVYLAQMGKDLVVTAKDAFQKTGAWQDAMREGIGSSYLTHESRSLTDPGTSIRSQLLPHLAKTRAALSYLNDTSDVWIRLAYRNRLIDSGLAPWRATALARDRLDYFQGGMVIKAFDTFIPYPNVTVQASGKVIEAAARDPSRAAIKAAWITGIAASVKLANMISSPETDKQISVMDKVRNFNITFGDQYYTIDQNGNKRYLYIPIRLDQVAMPINGAIVGGLELAGYGKVPNGLAGNTVGQVSPISSAFPIPTVDAIAAYASNYDQFTGGNIYKGSKVLPKDEVKTFGEGTPTGDVAKLAGQTLGLSPMRLEAAAGKLINTNNFYIQAMGGAYKLLFAGADPRDQAASTMMMLQQVPGLRSVVKLTSPASSLIDDLQKAEQMKGSTVAEATQAVNDLIFQQQHSQNGVTLKTVQDYINRQPEDMRQALGDHAKYTVAVEKVMEHFKASDGIPPRAWWVASAKAPGDVRAQAFYDVWVSANPGQRERLLGVANAMQANGLGYLSPEFQKAFAAERKLLGDEHR